jgi:hypothetical protein
MITAYQTTTGHYFYVFGANFAVSEAWVGIDNLERGGRAAHLTGAPLEGAVLIALKLLYNYNEMNLAGKVYD